MIDSGSDKDESRYECTNYSAEPEQNGTHENDSYELCTKPLK